MNNFSEEFFRFLHDKDVTIAKQSHYKNWVIVIEFA